MGLKLAGKYAQTYCPQPKPRLLASGGGGMTIPEAFC
jgi:hypothetical protein